MHPSTSYENTTPELLALKQRLGSTRGASGLGGMLGPLLAPPTPPKAAWVRVLLWQKRCPGHGEQQQGTDFVPGAAAVLTPPNFPDSPGTTQTKRPSHHQQNQFAAGSVNSRSGVTSPWVLGRGENVPKLDLHSSITLQGRGRKKQKARRGKKKKSHLTMEGELRRAQWGAGTWRCMARVSSHSTPEHCLSLGAAAGPRCCTHPIPEHCFSALRTKATSWRRAAHAVPSVVPSATAAPSSQHFPEPRVHLGGEEKGADGSPSSCFPDNVHIYHLHVKV